MIGSVFDSSTIPILEQVINFAQARHNVLAGNIANLHTPGYQTRDLSVPEFQRRLREAIESRNEKQETLSPHLVASRSGDPMRQVRDSLKDILYHDDSNVGMEKQVTEISKNQALHNLAITIMTSQYRLLQSAISERV